MNSQSSNDLKTLFAQHIESVTRYTEEALDVSRENGARLAGIVFHAGKETLYHADDHPVDFKSVPHLDLSTDK